MFKGAIERAVMNKFTEAFYGSMSGGGTYTQYDLNNAVYLEKGFLYNPTVYSVIGQKAQKANQIPFYVKKIKDENARKQLQGFKQATKGGLRAAQTIKQKALEKKAFEEEYLNFPMPKPNPDQSWSDIISLFFTFMDITGNFYLYKLKGEFDNKPLQLYVLPAHKIRIVLKEKADLMGMESPVDHYVLTEGNTSIKFERDEVIHIKRPNPDFDLDGSHLYGLSPLRPILRNVQSSNEGIDNNVRTMLNSGIFGFITGDTVALSPDQALQVKEQITEMRKAKEAMGHIRGASAKLNFTKVSVDTDKLQPFAYFTHDERQICNALGWDNKLLNDSDGAKYDNMETAEARVITNTILPMLKLLEDKMNNEFIREFKGYENTVFEFDPSDLPELQQDVKTMVDWLIQLQKEGALNRDEVREYVNFPKLETPEMQAYTVNQDIIPLNEAIANDFAVNDTGTV
jgi:HK97 family phage portal protein